jgi:uncharacterized membrane protein YkvA (DUF1232 family)
MRTFLRLSTLLNLLRAIPHLPKAVRLCWRLLRDRRVPFYLKAMVIGTLVYVFSPIDFIPAVIFPVVGYVDDLTLLALAGYYFIRWSPPDVVAEHLTAIDPLHYRGRGFPAAGDA